ncbi:MAG: class I mannose-6-phosphate isomerase [Sporomusaceae bacterium]|nr:class I mannose-6-phosphate isomerase [Sporomusaceae bacterium]
MTDGAKAIRLSPARAWRTYIGGRLLEELHGAVEAQDSHFPEEWILSVVAARNAGREAIKDEGMSLIAGVKPPLSLKALIAANADALLGVAHTARCGDNPGVLVKLIDAAERLTVQVHPDRAAARKLFGSGFGKTECWHILGGRQIDGRPPCVYLGFKPGITRVYWRELFARQDIPAMLDCLHRFEVRAGDTFLIEGGIPHAIGAGCFLVEIQEPTDFTIRVERTTPSGFPVADAMCHQGLGFEQMFDCFQYGGFSREETERRWRIPPQTLRQEAAGRECELIGSRHTRFFRLTQWEIDSAVSIDSGTVFSGLYVLSGRGTLNSGGELLPFQPGDQFFLPASAGRVTLERHGEENCRVLRCFGPDPG